MSIARLLDFIMAQSPNWRNKTIQITYASRVDAKKESLKIVGITFGFFCIEDSTPWT